MTVTAARELHKDQRGAIMLMGLCMSCFLIGGLWFLIGIGDTIVFRDQMQEATDHAAFTSAVLHAKGMNFLSACNLILLAIIAIHILMGIIHDILLAVCIVGAIFSLGTSCLPWVNFRKLYTGYFKIMTPVAKGIHFVEEVAQIGYPFIAVAKAYTLGNDYGNFGPKKRDINMLALSTSLVPGNVMSGAVNKLFGQKAPEKLPDGVQGPTRPASGGYSETKKGFLPVEAKHFDTICERIGTQGIKSLVSLTGEARGGKVMDMFYSIVGSILKVRYCCDLGEGCKEGLSGVVGGKLSDGNKKIDEQNKAAADKNAGLKPGEQQDSIVEPVKDTGGDSYVLDPGFSKFWGKDGPYVPWGGTANGSPWQQIWAINVMPSFTDNHQKKVHIGANNKGGIESDAKAYAYLAQAEFFYDCDDKWGEEACNKLDNAGYGIKWRARLRRLQLPQIGSMLSSFGGEFLKEMTSYKGFKDKFGGPALAEKFGKSIGVSVLSKAIGGLFGMIESAIGDKILGPAGDILNKAQNGLTGDFGVYHWGMTTMKPKSKLTRLLRAKSRSRARGAALVEAAVAIPVMLAFLGLTMFIHNSYDEKLASQTSTRAQVLYYASHNCEGSVPEAMSVQLGTKTSGTSAGKQAGEADPGGGNDGDKPAQKLGEDTKAGLSRGWNLANTHRDTTVGGTAVQEQKKVAFSAPVTSNSEAACNEKRFDNNWTAVFGYIKGFIKSGGGIID